MTSTGSVSVPLEAVDSLEDEDAEEPQPVSDNAMTQDNTADTDFVNFITFFLPQVTFETKSRLWTESRDD